MAQRPDELLLVAVPVQLGVIIVLGDCGHRHHILSGPAPGGGRLSGRQPAAESGDGSVAGARSSETPAEASASSAPGCAAVPAPACWVSSVRTAAMRSRGQTRCTAMAPSLLESART